MLNIVTNYDEYQIVHGVNRIPEGSFILPRKRRRHRFQMGSEKLSFNVHIEQ